MKSSKPWRRVVLIGLVAMPLAVLAAGVADPAQRAASVLSATQRPALLDVTRAGDRLVAVGERGAILLSTDLGKSWHQSPSPVSVTLTAVRFATPLKGWAVGHSGVVLHSRDGGASWVRQFDGLQAAQAVLRAAQADSGEGAEKRLSVARQFAADGADKPLLGLAFENERKGVVVGAYGLIFGTEDGGATWTPWVDRVPNPKGLHLYAVQRIGSDLFLAGEQGLFLRSRDDGHSFAVIESPYRGSYFTLAASSPDQLLLAGLRGNAYRFDTRTDAFQKLDVRIPVTLSASTSLPDGRVLFINQAGQWLVSAGDALLPLPTPPGPPAVAAVSTADGALAMATWRGAVRAELPSQPKGKP
jgi:photosystem II stability/assembly factor-like uncharacterized protein